MLGILPLYIRSCLTMEINFIILFPSNTFWNANIIDLTIWMLLPKLRTPAGRSFTWLDCCHDSPGGLQHCLIDSPLVSCELAIGREGAGDVRAVAVIFSSHIKQAEKETQGKKWQFSSKEIVEHGGSLNCSALNKICILVDHQYNHCLNTVLSKAGWQSLGMSWQKGICIPHGLNGHPYGLCWSGWECSENTERKIKSTWRIHFKIFSSSF